MFFGHTLYNMGIAMVLLKYFLVVPGVLAPIVRRSARSALLAGCRTTHRFSALSSILGQISSSHFIRKFEGVANAHFLLLDPTNIKTAEPIRDKFCVGSNSITDVVFWLIGLKY